MIKIKIKYDSSVISSEQAELLVKEMDGIVGKAFIVGLSKKMYKRKYEELKPKKVKFLPLSPTLSKEDNYPLFIEMQTKSSPELEKGNFERIEDIRRRAKKLNIIPEKLFTKDNALILTIFKKQPVPKFMEHRFRN